MIYLDTSAAAKALIRESQTDSIRRLFDEETEFVSSRLLAVELHAIADRRDLRAIDVRALVDRVAIISLNDDIAQRAIDLRSGLRTLDALHLGTALAVGSLVEQFLSFDDELNAAALSHGIPLHALATQK